LIFFTPIGFQFWVIPVLPPVGSTLHQSVPGSDFYLTPVARSPPHTFWLQVISLRSQFTVDWLPAFARLPRYTYVLAFTTLPDYYTRFAHFVGCARSSPYPFGFDYSQLLPRSSLLHGWILSLVTFDPITPHDPGYARLPSARILVYDCTLHHILFRFAPHSLLCRFRCCFTVILLFYVHVCYCCNGIHSPILHRPHVPHSSAHGSRFPRAFPRLPVLCYYYRHHSGCYYTVYRSAACLTTVLQDVYWLLTPDLCSTTLRGSGPRCSSILFPAFLCLPC